jgi:hypothetical protein
MIAPPSDTVNQKPTDAAQDSRPDTLAAALDYHHAGLAVTPVQKDGSKAPVLTGWQNRPFPSETDLHSWFAAPRYGIGMRCGTASANLELLDFDKEADTIFPGWCYLVEEEAPGLLDRLTRHITPRLETGYHVFYRCREVEIPGSTRLAQRPATDPKTGNPTREALIETRGEGGQGLVPGCPPECHETGGLYRHHAGPTLPNVQEISAAERDILLRAARSFDRTAGAKTEAAPPASGNGELLSKCKHSEVTRALFAWQETFREETAMRKKAIAPNAAARWWKPSAGELPSAKSPTALASRCGRCNAGSPAPVSSAWIAWTGATAPVACRARSTAPSSTWRTSS